jgi:hypothetical protein
MIRRFHAARAVVTILGQALAVGGDPAINPSRQRMQNRHAVQPNNPAPAGQPASDVIHRIGTDVNVAVRKHESHPGVEVRLSQDRKSIDERRRLPRQIFELVSNVADLDSGNLLATKWTFAVIYHDRTCYDQFTAGLLYNLLFHSM